MMRTVLQLPPRLMGGRGRGMGWEERGREGRGKKETGGERGKG